MSQKNMIEIEVKLSYSQQQLGDLLCTAFEGGINYWVDQDIEIDKWPTGAQYASEAIVLGAAGTLYYGDEEGQPSTTTLTLDKLKTGIALYIQSGRQFDIENYDAGDADNIIQFAVFGEIVYG